MPSFTKSLCKKAEGILKKIIGHPFLRGLSDGGLPIESFKFYVIQDALYLRAFGRGLALLGAKSERDEDLVMFVEHAKNAILVERALHKEFFEEWGISEGEVLKTQMAPTSLLYTSYILRVAYERPFYEGLGAFLPCDWIYWEVGKILEERGSPNRLYQKWIDTYSSKEFEEVVKSFLEIVDRISEKLTSEQKGALERQFLFTSRLEYMFWDMALRRETWPL